MSVIWKYALQGPQVDLEIPRGAKILDLRVQGMQPHIWAQVDPDQPMEKRTFCSLATGEHFDHEGKTYIGSAHEIGGWMVFHVFEETT